MSATKISAFWQDHNTSLERRVKIGWVFIIALTEGLYQTNGEEETYFPCLGREIFETLKVLVGNNVGENIVVRD